MARDEPDRPAATRADAGAAAALAVADPDATATDDGQLNHEFLHEQVRALHPYEFVRLAAPSSPVEMVEIGRDGDGVLSVCVPPRLDGAAIEVATRSKLLESGFTSADPAAAGKPWRRVVGSDEEGVDVAVDVLTRVFGNDLTGALDLAHGSHELEVEVARRVEEARSWLGPILRSVADQPPERDADEDDICIIDGARVVVAVRGVPGTEILIRIIVLMNGGVTITPDLGLFLARLNQMHPMARFVLDAEHEMIWVDDALLAEHIDEAAVRFALRMLTAAAKQWSGSIKQMFGGVVQADMDEMTRSRTEKPDLGGYL